MADIPDTVMDERFKVFKRERLCGNVFDMPYDLRCDYVTSSDNCAHSVNLLDYVQLIVCQMNIRRRRDEVKVIALFCLILLLCFFLIATVANEYYAPAMKVIARMLHMNEHLAGVTILAMGNSSSHMLEYLLHLNENLHIFTNSMAFSLFGILIPGGLLCYLTPFKMNAHETARDLLFFMLGTQILQLMLYYFTITRTECIVLMCYYCFYIVVVLVDNFLVKKTIRDVKMELDYLRSQVRRDPLDERLLERKLEELERDAGVPFKEGMRAKKTVRRSSFIPHHTDNTDHKLTTTRSAFHNSNEPPNRFLFIDFLEEISPIDRLRWRQSNYWGKVGMILKVPINLYCRLFIPRIDMEENRHAWSKLLNCIQIVMTPSASLVLIAALLESTETWYITFNYKYFLYPMPVTFIIAVGVFYTSRTDLPPRYHIIFAFMSIYASILTIFMCVSETVTIINTLGGVLGLSDDFMGATLGSLSAQIGDIAIDITMARQGYPQMAFASTLGGQFFNLIFAGGLAFMMKSISIGKTALKVDPGLYGQTCFIFIIVAILSTFLWTTILNFQSRRSVGIFNFCIYGIYFLMSVLAEAEIIHTYEKDVVLRFPEI